MDHQAVITESDLVRILSDENAEPKPLPFSLLERITNGFSYKMEIGRGGFAVVYKGMLEKGAVAVKRLSKTYMYEKEFLREIDCLMKVRHKNIARFLGYCVDTQGNMIMHEGKFVLADIQQRLLCFEFLPNGGLDRYIKDPSCGLDWIDRYDIIKGICEGLHHLHELNIVHLDLKPANILLDENMQPKITDFGTSRAFEKDQSRVLATEVLGTRGYMAPEFVRNLITKKYDLYSLGVIIMEIVTGEKTCEGVENVLKCWSDRLNISQRNQECEQIRECVMIGIECMDFDPANRPVNVKHIIERLSALERVEEILPRIKMLDIVFTSSRRSLHCLDIDHYKHWIITGEDNGHVRIWNYQTQKKVDSLKLSKRKKVVGIKFIARKQWFAAAFCSYIYVYSYETKMKKITRVYTGTRSGDLQTLAIHPTEPYLFSSHCVNIELWNWDKNWECTHIFDGNNLEACICQITFSSNGTIAGASSKGTVEVCSLDSPESNYTLSAHSTSVNCLEFFTLDDQEYLVTGSDDQTAKIWDMEQKICLCTLKDFMSPVMFVLYRPDLQILITGSQDGSIYFWRISSRIRRRPPKLDQTLSIGDGGVIALACSMGRVVITKKDELAIMDIDLVNSREKSMDYGEPHLSADTKPDRNKTSKVIARSSEELPVLDVHHLKLSSSEPNKHIECSVQLTNKSDANVAFRIREESGESTSELLTKKCGIVLSRSTYNFHMKTRHKMKLEEETDFVMVVQSSTLGERYDTSSMSESEYDEFFEDAEEVGHTVDEVTVRATYSLYWDRASKYYSPLEPRFYRELSESIPCFLHLTNKTDEYVVFRVVDSSWAYSNNETYGIVPPRSTCTLIGTTEDEMQTQQTGIDLLQSICIPVDKCITILNDEFSCNDFFKEAKKLKHAVYEASLKAIYTPQRGATTYEPAARPTVITQPIFLERPEFLYSMDAHPTEPWIVIGHYNGNVSVWNHESKIRMCAFKISDEPVFSIKFHATRKWIVAATGGGLIHVYDCACVTQTKEITSFSGCDIYGGCSSVCIHPTKPYVLSGSKKLLDGDKGWDCTQTFRVGGMRQLAFDPEDLESFASLGTFSHDVEVWNLDSPEPDYTLKGHSDKVNCLDFFKQGGRQYLITGSNDCTAKIWDLQKRACIHTLCVFMSPVSYVVSLPGRPYLVTCTNNETIHVWSSIDFRLKTTVNFSCGGDVHGLVCLIGSRRIAIGQEETISIMEIDDEEEVVDSEGNNFDSVCVSLS